MSYKSNPEDVKDFSDKLLEGLYKSIPKHMREDNPIDKEKEKSFSAWIERLRKRYKKICI